MSDPDINPQVDGLYRERAHLVALLTRLFPTAIWTDPAEPDWPILYLTTPAGQLSWHINRADMDLFDTSTFSVTVENPWDGHDTLEKYRRVDQLIQGAGWVILKVEQQLTRVTPGCADTSATQFFRSAGTTWPDAQKPLS